MPFTTGIENGLKTKGNPFVIFHFRMLTACGPVSPTWIFCVQNFTLLWPDLEMSHIAHTRGLGMNPCSSPHITVKPQRGIALRRPLMAQRGPETVGAAQRTSRISSATCHQRGLHGNRVATMGTRALCTLLSMHCCDPWDSHGPDHRSQMDFSKP